MTTGDISDSYFRNAIEFCIIRKPEQRRYFMIRIYRSNKLKVLASKLAADLKTDAPSDPLKLTEIVVPNRDTARWLKLCLAERTSIIANVEFILPAEWQFRQIRKLYPDLPELLAGDPGPLAWAVFDILMNDKQRRQFPRPDRYVSSQPPEIKERAVMQLSKKIASVFDQYLVYRPEMILKWQQGETGDTADERWQSDLWRLLENKRKIKEEGSALPNKAELIRETSDALLEKEHSDNKPLLFFNPGLLPQPVLQMAKNVSAHQKLIIFQSAASEKRAGRFTNSLLAAFGDETKGQNILLESLDAEAEDDFDVANPGTSVLNTIQKSIVTDGDLSDVSVEVLSGIEIHSCHSPLREVEVLHQFLLRRFEGNPELYPDDILVMMPDIETYKPIIHAVFGTEQEGVPSIPYHVDYRRLSSESLTRAFLQLLDLADSRYSFSDVMDFLMEPAVHQSFDMSESAVRRLKRWVEENNVIWGLSADHRKEEDQPGATSQTWQSALHRGWDGIVLGERSDPFSSDQSLRFSDIQGQDMEEMWAGFSDIVAHFEKINHSVKSKRMPAAWAALMEEELNYYFSSDSVSSDPKSNIRQALDEIADESKVAGFDRKISYSMFRSHLKSLLDRQSASPAHFTRGVTFSSMVPVRSIPAKIIALIGLNESEFPRKVRHTDFDLMASDPRPYERNPKHQDRSLFLESIQASETCHYCSYIGRSRTDNETIPPSPIISEWLTTLSKLTGRPAKEILSEEPLHGFSAENYRSNRSYSKIGYLTARGLLEPTVHTSGLFAGSEINEIDIHKPLTVNILERFISNPLKGYLKEHFSPDLGGIDEEKNEFDLSALEKHKLFERVFGWRLQDRKENKISDMLKNSGIIPAGWKGDLIVRDLIKSIDTAIESVGKRGIDLSLFTPEVSINIGDYTIEGSFLSYSETQFLDITPSSEAGDKFLKSWIRHLISQCANLFPERNSWFVCELKKGDPKWYRFTAAEDPESELNRFISLYHRGLKAPVLTFPNASFAYEKRLFEEKDDPMSKARTTFEGSDYAPYADNRDPFITLVLGEDAPFLEEYLDPELSKAITTMLSHMEKL